MESIDSVILETNNNNNNDSININNSSSINKIVTSIEDIPNKSNLFITGKPSIEICSPKKVVDSHPISHSVDLRRLSVSNDYNIEMLDVGNLKRANSSMEVLENVWSR